MGRSGYLLHCELMPICAHLRSVVVRISLTTATKSVGATNTDLLGAVGDRPSGQRPAGRLAAIEPGVVRVGRHPCQVEHDQGSPQVRKTLGVTRVWCRR